MEDWEIPKWRQEGSLRIARRLILASLVVYLVVYIVIQTFPRRWFVAPRHWNQGPILDARFTVGPLDPKPIDGTCPVHHLQLQEDVVRIDYGLILPMEGEDEARQDQFPFANSSYLGGCCVSEPTRARVLFCSECREAEKEWLRNTQISH
jgi:hypothetical protein